MLKLPKPDNDNNVPGTNTPAPRVAIQADRTTVVAAVATRPQVTQQ